MPRDSEEHNHVGSCCLGIAQSGDMLFGNWSKKWCCSITLNYICIIAKHIELETYRDLIGCDWIDIARRNIGDKEYDIVVDDEGLLKENPIVSAFSGTKDPVLVGTMVICGTADSEGVLTGLSEEDLENIKKHKSYYLQIDSEGYPVIRSCIVGMEY